jgi:hypothetical protein
MNLNKTYDEIMDHLRALDITPFLGTPIIDENNANIVVWDPESDDWRTFIEIAKKEGAKSMIVGKGERVTSMMHEIGSITLIWMKEGIVYMFRKQAEWWDKEYHGGGRGAEDEDLALSEFPNSISQPFENEKKKEEEQQARGRSISPFILVKVKEATDEDLAQELVSFYLSRSLSRGIEESLTGEVCSSFWARKGISEQDLREDPELRSKTRRVEHIAREKIERTKPLEIMKRSDEELAIEEIEFLKSHAEGNKRFSYMDSDLFWETKGAVRYTAEPGLRFKMEKVDSIVRNILGRSNRVDPTRREQEELNAHPSINKSS